MPPSDSETLASLLEATGDYQVLRRLDLPAGVRAAGGGERRTAVVVDVETTGLDPIQDAIIQFCGIPFSYDPADGRVLEIGAPWSGYDDPGRPIPPAITALTGITDAQVAGQRLDEAALAALIDPAVLIIAHNAGFDRPFLDRRFAALFGEKHWACSLEGIPWKRYGLPSGRLEFLLFKRHRRFFNAHSAETDCQALLYLLTEPFDDGVLPLALLLEDARRRLVRIWAIGSPIEQKDLLKARGYRFNGGTDGRPKSWYRDLAEGADGEAELAWLRETIYRGREGWRIEKLDPRKRYARG